MALISNIQTLGANLDANSHKVINVTDPTSAQDAATKAYVDANAGDPSTWSTFDATQDVDMDSHKLTNVTDPSSAQDAATKNYTDTTFVALTGVQTVAGVKTFSSAPVLSGASITSGTIPIASVIGTAMDLTTAQSVGGVKTFTSSPVFSANINMSSNKIINLSDPASANDAANKQYVDNNFVDLTNAQTVAGVKTFSSAPVMSGASITSGTIPIASVVGTAVALSGSQTITGAKTFTGGADFTTVAPTSSVTPSSGNDLINKTYADANYADLTQATVSTSDATPTAVATIAIATNTSVMIKAFISAQNSAHTNFTGGEVMAMVGRAAGSPSIISTSVPIVCATSSATFDITISGNNALILVTGIAATTYNWKVRYFTVVN